MTSVIWLHTVIKQCFTYVLENKNPGIKYTSIIVSNVSTQRHAEYTSKFMVGFPKINSQRLGQGAKKIIFIYSLPFREAEASIY